LKVPEAHPTKSQELIIYDKKGKEIAKVPIPVNTTPRSSDTPKNIQFPTYLRAGNTCHIKGNFDGIMGNSKVMLGEQPISVIAESPDRIICEIPNTASGLQKITVTENGITNSATCNVVGMNLSVGKFNLLKGESTNLAIEVYGLDNIETPVAVLVENKTPENINLSGGNSQNITIYPNEASAEGTYNKTIQIQSKRAGNYTIDVTLIESFEDEIQNNPVANPTDSNPNQDVKPLINNIDIPDSLISYNPSVDIGYNVAPNALLSTSFLPNVLFSYNVMIDDDQKRKLRNKGRKLPANTPLGPKSPNDKKNPHSRPVPDGIKAPFFEVFPGVWKRGEALLKEAKKEVERAKAHKGEIKVGVPGTDVIGVLNAHREV